MTEEVSSLVEAIYRLSAVEQRLIQYSIAQCEAAQQSLSAEDSVRVVADVFAAQFPQLMQGVDVYDELEDALDALSRRYVTLRDQDPESGEERVTLTRWITVASYLPTARTIELTLAPEVVKSHEKLKEALDHPRLAKFAGMNSPYAVRLYEQLHNQHGQHEFSLEDVRVKLQVAPKEYKLTADLKKWVLDVAIAQVNQHGDVDISYEHKKTGRAITHFVFTVKPKATLGGGEDQAYRNRLEANGQKRLDEE